VNGGIEDRGAPGASEPDDALAAAKACHQAGRLDEAAALCEEALAAGDTPDALHVLALVRFQQRRLEDADTLVRRALASEPGNGAFLNSLGLILLHGGHVVEAEAKFREALAVAPSYVQAQVNLGTALRLQGRLADAHAAVNRAIKGKAATPTAYFEMAKIAHARGDLARAAFWDGGGWYARQDYDRALDCYRQAFATAADHRTLQAIGRSLTKLGRPGEAISALEGARKMMPDDPSVLHDLGSALVNAHRHQEAVRCFDRAIEIDRENVKAHIGKAQALLGLGRYAEGWREFEWRLRNPIISQEAVRRPFEKPGWDGRRLDGERLLVHTEQGKGDIIQFVRYLPMVQARGGHVIFECEAELRGLMSRVAGYDELVVKAFDRDEPYVDHDLHVSLVSLPFVFATTPATIPSAVPYLSADEDRVARWRPQLRGEGRSIGLAWAGNPRHPNNRNRSIALERFAPLAATRGVRFYSLQVGEAAWQTPPAGLDLTDLGRDFDETAAIMANLDLVVTVDTSICHLAGALARPVWTLLSYAPDWRWMIDREDTPWYPTMRLYRQPSPGDWDSVIERVARDLERARAGTDST
jgi:Flp pilus assembly protein TadD